jgi:hypothetical protein
MSNAWRCSNQIHRHKEPDDDTISSSHFDLELGYKQIIWGVIWSTERFVYFSTARLWGAFSGVYNWIPARYGMSSETSRSRIVLIVYLGTDDRSAFDQCPRVERSDI